MEAAGGRDGEVGGQAERQSARLQKQAGELRFNVLRPGSQGKLGRRGWEGAQRGASRKKKSRNRAGDGPASPDCSPQSEPAQSRPVAARWAGPLGARPWTITRPKRTRELNRQAGGGRVDKVGGGRKEMASLTSVPRSQVARRVWCGGAVVLGALLCRRCLVCCLSVHCPVCWCCVLRRERERWRRALPAGLFSRPKPCRHKRPSVPGGSDRPLPINHRRS